MAQRSRPLPVITGDIGFALHDAVRRRTEEIIALTCEIALVPAPTNDEQRRSVYVQSKMTDHGFSEIHVDEIGNVVGRIKGSRPGPPLLIAAHLDTVFSLDTLLSINRSDDRLSCPGIGDNSLGVGAVLSLISVLRTANIVPAVDWIITGNVGEEGLGNLRGIRAVLDSCSEIGAVIAVEGHNLGRVTNVAVGSRRYRVCLEGPGGHSWGDFGNPSTIHGAADVISDLVRISLPNSPKTTMNVGMIEGGISVNTIAPSTSFLLDLRSVDAEALDKADAQVNRVLDKSRKGLRVSSELLGVRPAGKVSPDSYLVKIARSVLESLGIEPIADASSTDANVPISRGIPAICLGLTNGGNVHREDEFVELAPITDGVFQLAATALAMSEVLSKDCSLSAAANPLF